MKARFRMVSLSLFVLFLFTSCGGDGDSGGSSGSGRREEENSTDLPADGSNIDGTYLATLKTLNSHVNGTVPSSVTFFRKDDKLMVFARLFAGGQRAWHQQAVYLGNRCPDMSDDKNKDGYIDIMEARKVLGQIIIPLDANITSQLGGRNFFPLGDMSGSYHYERVTSFRQFFRGLQGEDSDPEDNITTLKENQGLELIGKPVMIQGTADTVLYPETVETTPRHRPHQTLPVACGIFAKVTKDPGVPDSGRIPGPVAEVVDDQDRPAPEGEGEIPATTAGSQGGSNENEEGETSDQDHGGSSGGGTSTGGSSGGSGGESGGTSGGTF